LLIGAGAEAEEDFAALVVMGAALAPPSEPGGVNGPASTACARVIVPFGSVSADSAPHDAAAHTGRLDIARTNSSGSTRLIIVAILPPTRPERAPPVDRRGSGVRTR